MVCVVTAAIVVLLSFGLFYWWDYEVYSEGAAIFTSPHLSISHGRDVCINHLTFWHVPIDTDQNFKDLHCQLVFLYALNTHKKSPVHYYSF